MTREQSVESFIATELHSLLFFEEFTFARNRFSPPQGSELELADAVVMLGDTLLIYQIKERSAADAGDQEAERRWFDSAIRRSGLKQIRNTLGYLSGYDEINVPNERGRTFNLAARRYADILKLVIYHPSTNLPDDCRSIRCHISKTAGFIHIVTAQDYLEIARTLRVPRDVVEYFKYRERVLRRFVDRHAQLHDASIAGHFIGGNHETLPTINSLKFLHQLIQDAREWDISGLLRGIHDHKVAPGYSDDDYYAILIEFAKLPRSMWYKVKERVLLCIEKVKKGETIRPYRMAYPATGTGFVFIAVPPEVSRDLRWPTTKLLGLRNFTAAHKYDQKLGQCIGVQVSFDGEYFEVLWCLISHAWENDPEMQRVLESDFPFRAVRETVLQGYKFDDDSDG